MVQLFKHRVKGHVAVAFLLFGLVPLVKIGGIPGFAVTRFLILAVVTGCALIYSLVRAAREDATVLRLTPVDAVFAVFYLLYFLSYATSANREVSFTGVIEEFTFLALYVLFRVMFGSGKDAEGFGRAVAVSAVFAALALSLWGQLQYFIDFDVPRSLKLLFKTHHFPVIASMGNPNFLAETLTLSLPLAAACLNFTRRSAVAAAIIVVMGLTVFLTYSRLAWFGFILLLTLLTLGAPGGGKKILAAALGTVLLLWAGFFAYHAATGSTRTSRVIKTFSLAPGTPLYDRAVIYGSALAMLRDAGFTGMGPGMFGYRYLEYQGDFIEKHPDDFHRRRLVDLDHAHCDILEMGIDSGYSAMGVYFFLLVAGSAAGLARLFSGRDGGPLGPLNLLPLGFLFFSIFAFPFYIPQSRQFFCLGYAFLASQWGRSVDVRAGKRLPACIALTALLLFAWPSARLMVSTYHYSRGLAFFGNNFSRAFDHFGRGIGAYPYYGYNYFSMGALMLNAGSQMGLRYLEESLRYLNNSSTYLYLARGSREHGKAEESGQWYRYILRNRPDLCAPPGANKEVIDGGKQRE